MIRKMDDMLFRLLWPLNYQKVLILSVMVGGTVGLVCAYIVIYLSG